MTMKNDEETVVQSPVPHEGQERPSPTGTGGGAKETQGSLMGEGGRWIDGGRGY